MERRVYSFSVKHQTDVELIEQIKADCDRRKQNFSAVLLELIKEARDERVRTASESH
jgi:hypothetical protein